MSKSPGASGGDNAPAPGDKGRKVRVDFRRNRSKRVRDKGEWTRTFQDQEFKGEDHHTGESVRAKGALSRRRTIIEAAASPDTARLDGFVTAVRGLGIQVDVDGRALLCCVRRALLNRLTAERVPLAVGDRVRCAIVSVEGGGGGREGAPEIDAVIDEVLPRRGVLSRRYADRVHVIAANVDQAVIVASVTDPPLRPHLIDRYLVAAHQGGLRPVICINKVDFEITEESGEILADVVNRYGRLGYRVVLTSAASGIGINELRAEMKGCSSVVVGMSGVGKSSLLNAVQPGWSRRVGAIDAVGRGQHTTTTAELLRLAEGGYVVDTPGIRQLELAEFDVSELEAYFPEIAERVAGCKFSDCRHIDEADCAVRRACEAGEIHPERLDSYVRLLTQRIEEQAW